MAMRTAEQAVEQAKGLTFEKVWAMFEQSDRRMAETDRRMAESKAEHDRMIAELKESAKELNRQMGGLHQSFGDLTANLVAPNLPEKFRELGYTFTKCSCEMKFKDSAGITLAEVDAWLENGDVVLAVEIKGKLLKRDVDDHLERMKVLHDYAKEHGDKRKLLGAVAGGITRKDARDYAVKSGFYVLEQSGDTLKIEMPKGFKPKTW
ncbi:MAG: hypothetical protein LBT01_08595 [Spirochaetaceae bacterium]|jgi:hypothetical protein|nr:hypothetical protein [Spirochaetaceae bacterium]